MVTIDGFDQIGQYSNKELQHKLHQLKYNSLNNFIEAWLYKTYDLYKKNKKSNITFMDYRTLMLKELEKHKSNKNNKPFYSSKPDKPKLDMSYFSFSEESSICSL